MSNADNSNSRPKKEGRPPIILPPALQCLAEQKHWVVWQLVQRKDGKPTKPPFRADAPSQHARSNDPSTWCDFATAMRTYTEGLCDGIGFVLTGTDIVCFDVDDCRNRSIGTLHAFASYSLRCSCTYAEVTPSRFAALVPTLK
jgi:primase-polymerase (primpol)-like protein